MDRSASRYQHRTPSAKLACGAVSSAIIGLDAIKAKAGDRWEKMHESVCARLESLLHQSLGPTDFFMPIDETSYLVTMSSASVDDVQVCCLRIAHELHASLLGPCSLEHLKIASAVTIADDILEITPLVLPKLLHLAERAQIREMLVPSALEEYAAAEAEMPRTGGGEPDQSPEFVFAPVWDSQRQVVMSYRCLPRNLRPVYSDSVRERAGRLSKLSLATLNCAVTTLGKHIAAGQRFLVAVPLSYEALATPVSRMDIVAACRQLSCDLRPYLIFEIVEMPAGVPHSRMLDLATFLQPFGRGVLAEVPAAGIVPSTFEGSGLSGVGFSLRLPHPPNLRWEIERLRAVTKKLNMGAFVNDVPTADLVRLAVDAGVQWLSGHAVLPPAESPGPIMRVGMDAILQRSAG